jgi:hypothetical protein
MDQLTLFLGQVIVVLMMLAGIFLGDYAAHLLFGGIGGRIKRLAYTLLFVVFLVVGSYLPAFLGAGIIGFYGSVILQTCWGFSSVFASRSILFASGLLLSRLSWRRPRKKKQPAADMGYIVRRLQELGLSRQDIEAVLAASLDSRKSASALQKKAQEGGLLRSAQMNPCRLAAAAHRFGIDPEAVTELVMDTFSLTPEKAATVWRRST